MLPVGKEKNGKEAYAYFACVKYTDGLPRRKSGGDEKKLGKTK